MTEFPKEVSVRECPECQELIEVEEVKKVNCFKLSDFKEIADGNEELILAEKVFGFSESHTLEVNQCPNCNGLFEDFLEEQKKMWVDEYGELFETKEDAMEYQE